MDRDLLLAAYASVLTPASATYCSTPITSGQTYFAWLDAAGLDIPGIDHADAAQRTAHRAAVVAPNCARARAVVDQLRAASGTPVIDPTAIPHVPAWDQPDWLDFWTLVIERFAASVAFVDGWEFSYGCTHEYAVARRLGLPTINERGEPLEVPTALQLIEGAIAEIRRRRGSTRQLEHVHAELAASLAAHDGTQFAGTLGPSPATLQGEPLHDMRTDVRSAARAAAPVS